MTIQVRSNEKPQVQAAPSEGSPAPESASQLDKQGDQGQLKEPENQTSAPEASAEKGEATEQKTTSESDPEDKQAEPEQGEAEKKENEESPHKKKGGFQRRIDKLNAQKAQATQEAEFWKQQALKHASVTKTDSPAAPPIPPISSAQKPIPENFSTHAEYVEALTDWKTEEKLKERDQRKAKEALEQEQAKQVNSYTERVKKFTAEKASDYQEILSEVDHIPLSPALRDMILNSENGPQIAYALAKDPEEFERIAKLPPGQAYREVGKFEARLEASSKGSAEPKKTITHAPKPIEPVGTGGKGTASKSIFDSNLSQSAYEALRREQIKKRRQAS